MLLSPRKTPRALSKVPFKVLDAPELAVSKFILKKVVEVHSDSFCPSVLLEQDDFYLNLVDWSSTNTLAVGLASCVYLWSAQTSSVVKLCDLADIGDSVTSLGWIQRVSLTF
jgi:cell division cycle 20-like protein 1 (cofactor of APC complex)